MRYYLQPVVVFIVVAIISFTLTDVHASANRYKTLLDFPIVTTHLITDDVSDGYVFLTPGTPRNESLLILDNAGEPVYYQTAPEGYNYQDFKVQPDGSLTYIQSQLIAGAPATIYQMNNTYSVINSFDPVGYSSQNMDRHEFQILPNGNGMFIIHKSRVVDMTGVVEGGLPNVIAIDNVVQEVDEDNNLIFEWDGGDYYDVSDTLIPGDLEKRTIDYTHGNSLELDDDGNILFSARNISEVTKIDRQTGEIIWRMGGNHNEFTLTGDDAFFSFQHDARRVSADTITLFDNSWRFDDQGDLYSYSSRVVEYRLDEVNKTIELVWLYEHPGGIGAHSMGNAQRQANGNTMIGWGSSGYDYSIEEQRLFSEVSADGQLVYDVEIEGQGSYRAFRFDWEGAPLYPPTLLAERNIESVVDLYYSWNGATNVAVYVLYAGTQPDALELLTAQQKNGFENSYQHTINTNEMLYYQVIPFDAEGNRLISSPIIELPLPSIPLAMTLNTPTTSRPLTFSLSLLSISLYLGVVTQKIGRKR